MGTPGPLEIGLVLLIVLIFVGPKKLPGLGKSLGTGLREFKDSVSGDKKDPPALEEHRQADAAAVTPPAQPVAEPSPLAKDPVDQPAPPREAGE